MDDTQFAEIATWINQAGLSDRADKPAKLLDLTLPGVIGQSINAPPVTLQSIFGS